MGNGKRVVLYLRLSKEDLDKCGGDNSESIINQRLLLTDHALAQGWTVVDTYIDDDYSGLYDDLPAFDRLIRDSKLGKFDIVLCKSQSRFTRNMEHLEKYLHHDFVLLGIRFVALADGVDTEVEGNKKTRQIYGLTNEWYSEDLSRNIRSVFRAKMKAGQFLGSFAPYGYLRDPEDRHQFVIDEYAAGVVNLIFDLALQGYGSKTICYRLEDMGIDSPTVYKRKQGNYANVRAGEFTMKYNLWSTTTVNRILGNETYIGTLIQGRWEKVSYKDKKVVETPKERWVIVENHHPPIIAREKFDQVQKIIATRRYARKGEKVHLLAGRVKCADCGSTMIKSGYTTRKKEDWYLRCQLANKSRNQYCTAHLIRYSVIVDVVLQNIRELVTGVLENRDRKEQISQLLEQITEGDRALQETQKALRTAREKKELMNQKLSLLYEDRVQGNISQEQFLNLKGRFDQECDNVEKTVMELEEKADALEQEKSKKKDIEELIGKYCCFDKLTYEMVTDFIDYIEVGEKDPDTEKQEIRIHWNL